MLKVTLDEAKSIAILEPDNALSEEDFKSAAGMIDSYLEKSGGLKGIVIYTKEFPGWDSFAALVSHFKFIQEHHKKVTYVAFVTDSPIGSLVEHVAGHFVHAEIKNFTFSELKESIQWISGNKS